MSIETSTSTLAASPPENDLLPKLIIAMHHTLQQVRQEVLALQDQVQAIKDDSQSLYQDMQVVKEGTAHLRTEMDSVQGETQEVRQLAQGAAETASQPPDLTSLGTALQHKLENLEKFQADVTIFRTVVERIPEEFKKSVHALQEENDVLEERISQLRQRFLVTLILGMMLTSVLTVSGMAFIHTMPTLPAFLAPVQKLVLGK